MRRKLFQRLISGASLCFAVLWAFPVSAQSISSGSTGALGPFNPTSNTTVPLPPDGVLNYTTVNVASGVTVTFTPNAANTPVIMLASGDVTIAGTISVNGANGANVNESGTVTVNQGGLGGPGGFAGGSSGIVGPTNNNGSYGQGPGGGVSTDFGTNAVEGAYGAPTSFVGLIPLFGGSGGGGVGSSTTITGASGGGGGGAIVIASTTKITVNSTGIISANGGDGGGQLHLFQGNAGGGSGGAIRLVAPQITSSGTIRANGGLIAFTPQGSGADGRIRLEAVTFGTVNTTTPVASTSNTLGPITANSTPALVDLPTLMISSVGGIAAPATPTGSYTTADVSLPTGTTNPVPVTLTAQHIPLNTTFTVKAIPQFATPSSSTCTTNSGTFSNATCTANVTFTSGVVSVLNAFASFTLTASLFPLIDGEQLDRVMVAATYGEPSTVTLITKSAKEIRVDQLPLKDQLAFAKGWEAMRRDQ